MHAALAQSPIRKKGDPCRRESHWGFLVAFVTLTLLFIPILSRT